VRDGRLRGGAGQRPKRQVDPRRGHLRLTRDAVLVGVLEVAAHDHEVAGVQLELEGGRAGMPIADVEAPGRTERQRGDRRVGAHAGVVVGVPVHAVPALAVQSIQLSD